MDRVAEAERRGERRRTHAGAAFREPEHLGLGQVSHPAERVHLKLPGVVSLEDQGEAGVAGEAERTRQLNASRGRRAGGIEG